MQPTPRLAWLCQCHTTSSMASATLGGCRECMRRADCAALTCYPCPHQNIHGAHGVSPAVRTAGHMKRHSTTGLAASPRALSTSSCWVRQHVASTICAQQRTQRSEIPMMCVTCHWHSKCCLTCDLVTCGLQQVAHTSQPSCCASSGCPTCARDAQIGARATSQLMPVKHPHRSFGAESLQLDCSSARCCHL